MVSAIDKMVMLQNEDIPPYVYAYRILSHGCVGIWTLVHFNVSPATVVMVRNSIFKRLKYALASDVFATAKHTFVISKIYILDDCNK